MIRVGTKSFPRAWNALLPVGVVLALIVAASYVPASAQSAAPSVIFITSGSSWAVPSDWNSGNNSIEVIGGGGGGADNTSIQNGGGGGGGGAYSKATNVSLTPGSTITYQVGSAGVAGQSGGDTYFCNAAANCTGVTGSAVQVGAKGGGAGAVTTGGAGGQSSSGVGSVRHSGGSGGTGGNGDRGGGGGGGAAGPNGAGASGGVSGSDGGGGGGGANSGSQGGNSSGDSGAVGGNNRLGSGGGFAGNPEGGPGSNGGGGGGADDRSGSVNGGVGGSGTEWGAHGAGGGGGGGGDDRSRGGAGGFYGGGGAGSGAAEAGGTTGGSGAPGLIVITYVPLPPVEPPVEPPAPGPVPSCSITFDQNPIQEGGGTTIRWTSSDADSFFINTIGFVSASGQAQVSPSQTTDYDGTVENESGVRSCDALLVVGQEAPQCIQTCPTGYTLQGNQCVLTSCPEGYTVHNGQCVSVQCPVVQASGCTDGFICRGDEVWHRDAFCTETFDRACPFGCSGGGCLLPSSSGNITASPSLVALGNTTTISWSTNGMEAGSCSVTGSNGDGPWAGDTGSEPSSAIDGQTTYTLTCATIDGEPFTDAVTIQILPIFQET